MRVQTLAVLAAAAAPSMALPLAKEAASLDQVRQVVENKEDKNRPQSVQFIELETNFAPEVVKEYKVFSPNHGLKVNDGFTTMQPADLAMSLAKKLHPLSEFKVTSAYRSKNGVFHVYLKQVIAGIEVQDGDMNVNVKDGEVISYGDSAFKGSSDSVSIRPLLPALAALKGAAKYLRSNADFVPLNERTFVVKDPSAAPISEDEQVSAELAFVQMDGGRRLELCWKVNLRQEEHWLDTYVSANTGEVVSMFDWVSGATYNVYPISVNDPLDGDRKIEVDPSKRTKGSPLGWHDQGNNRKFTDTRGNNVYAQENFSGRTTYENNYRPSAADLDFDFPLDLTKEPNTYIDAATTNLFYWNNVMHDIFYEYGFDEVSGNFQENNFNNGGLQNDAVIANAQDGSGYNNANFATPPDGQKGKMRMYVWNQVTPKLDGDLDNGIIIHEYAHGISTRLTGGPSNSNCLGSGQAGGMGEGWGDLFATFLRWRPEYTYETTFAMGDYAAGRGIRPYPYSTNMTVNPQTLSFVDTNGYGGVHAKGSVWCTILMEAFHLMVGKHGFDKDWYKGKGGNNMILQDVVDGMKLQPCRPTFVDARNAIIQADMLNYNGTNECLLWRGFAKRGLGVNAVASPAIDSFDIPNYC